MRRAAGLALAALIAAAPVPASAAVQASQAEESFDPSTVLDARDDGSLVHKPSGFVFPAKLGPLPLTGPKIIAADDIMARYGLAKEGLGDAWLDLILYPAEQTLSAEADGVEGMIVDHFQAKSIPDPAAPPSAASDGRHGWFKGTVNGTEMITTYVLVQRDGWLVKVRATARASAGAKAIDQLVAAIADVPWAWEPSTVPEQDTKTVALR